MVEDRQGNTLVAPSPEAVQNFCTAITQLQQMGIYIEYDALLSHNLLYGKDSSGVAQLYYGKDSSGVAQLYMVEPEIIDYSHLSNEEKQNQQRMDGAYIRGTLQLLKNKYMLSTPPQTPESSASGR